MKLLPCSPTDRMTRSIRNGAGHVARVFEQTDEREENRDLRQEHQHRPHAGEHPVHDERAQVAWQQGATALPALAMSASMPSMSGVAHVNTDWNTTAISSRNSTGPHTRCSAIRSMRSERLFVPACARVTVRPTTCAIQA